MVNGAGELRSLIESEIPDARLNLETSYANLERVAAYCEANYAQVSGDVRRKAMTAPVCRPRTRRPPSRRPSDTPCRVSRVSRIRSVSGIYRMLTPLYEASCTWMSTVGNQGPNGHHPARSVQMPADGGKKAVAGVH
jgi:hypothetical protein